MTNSTKNMSYDFLKWHNVYPVLRDGGMNKVFFDIHKDLSNGFNLEISKKSGSITENFIGTIDRSMIFLRGGYVNVR